MRNLTNHFKGRVGRAPPFLSKLTKPLLVFLAVCLFGRPAEAQYGGGTGKTTAEMQTASTFLEAGWDFLDETVNGTDDIWWILEGQDYPRLWWELIEDGIAESVLEEKQS